LSRVVFDDCNWLLSRAEAWGYLLVPCKYAASLPGPKFSYGFNLDLAVACGAGESRLFEHVVIGQDARWN
jgi:hypothetical protein